MNLKIQKINHRLNLARMVGARISMRRFANRYGLVYFGGVDSYSEDHKLVQGMTASAEHLDNHYCIGNVGGYDLILLERSDTHKFPGRPSKYYRWIILQIDLKPAGKPLPHVVIEGRHHDDTFFANLFIKHAHLRPVHAGFFVGHEPQFINHFSVYTSPGDVARLPAILTPDITAAIGRHYQRLDFEMSHDTLWVYASNLVITKSSLDAILKAGLWLAGALERNPL
ncbi:MAG: hypothetical protein EOT04_02865 [Candidatus Chaera renei]|uniref:Uncharacterized protein n=1 Tax=Candidatus Chaera renei TaxID=2506947 RepID=A0A4Q0AG37_9BACT|nr:MAG: hypothetical protein EOT04_02865 [Candidatus Chaera renei]